MRKRLKRIALYAAIALVVLMVAAVLIVRSMLTGPRVKSFLEKTLSENLKQKVTIEAVALEFWKGLDITGLTVHNGTDTPTLTVKEINIEADVKSIIKSRLGRVTASVTVKGPSLFLEIQKEEPVPDAVSSAGTKSSSTIASSRESGALLGPIKMFNFNFVIEDGTARLVDGSTGSETAVRALSAKLGIINLDVPSLKGAITYELSGNLGTLELPGIVKAEGKVDFDLVQ